MAKYKVEIRPKADDGTYPDIIYPKTTADMVVDEETGQTIAEHLGDDTIHFKKSDVSKSDVGLSNVDNVKQIPASEKGVPGGVATLDESGILEQGAPNLGKPLYFQEFNSSGTWNKPPDVGTIYVEVLGGGGAGGGGGSSGYTDWRTRYGGTGGGGGAISFHTFKSNELPNSVTVIVGSGGVGTYGNGADGGYSEFHNIRANGGKGGSGATNVTNSSGQGGSESLDYESYSGKSGGGYSSEAGRVGVDSFLSAPGGGSGTGAKASESRDKPIYSSGPSGAGGRCGMSGLNRASAVSGYGASGRDGGNGNWIAGNGGSGGVGNPDGKGGNGGNGGRGAGGGGASFGSDGGGKGGNGGNGCVRVYAW